MAVRGAAARRVPTAVTETPGVPQFVLDLPHRAALGRDAFLVTDANREAVAWIDRWPDWPAPALCLHGPPGAGKSHLAEVWRVGSGADLVTADRLPGLLEGTRPDALLGPSRRLVIDGLDGVLGHAAGHLLERPLLHLYNLAAEGHGAGEGGALLIVGRTPPSRWSLRVPDLGSRLTAAPAVALGPPDDALMQGVLGKLFADRQIAVGVEVIRFLATRIERSFAAARAVVEALDRRALAEKRAVTVPLARAVVAEIETADTGKD